MSIYTQDGFWCASSSVFPDCKGRGKTESEAIQKLVRSITRYISKSTQESLQSLLHSSEYTQVILDVSSKKKGHKRLFSLDGNLPKMGKLFFVKTKKFKSPDIDQVMQVNKSTFDLMCFNSDESNISNGITDATPPLEDSDGAIVKQILQDQKEEGYIFGFPLSFN